jgi:hypothetical protein
MWRNASTEDKRYFIENEARLRAEYNENMSKWRKAKVDGLAAKIRLREAAVRDAIDHGTVDSLVKAAEVSQQTLFSTDSVAAYEEPHESNVQHALPRDYSRYPSYHSTAFGHTFYQSELSSMSQCSASYRQSPGCNIPITSNNLSYNLGYYDREICSYEGTNTYQQKSLPQYKGRAVSPEQDPSLSYGRWNCFQSTEGGRWRNGPNTASNYKHFSMEQGYHYFPYLEDSRANYVVAPGERSTVGWNCHD